MTGDYNIALFSIRIGNKFTFNELRHDLIDELKIEKYLVPKVIEKSNSNIHELLYELDFKLKEQIHSNLLKFKKE
jgi:D-ribose pyranose/furanose isomerase RbsD